MRTRDCIICPPVLGPLPPGEGPAIKAMCGVCRGDIWVSDKGKEQFAQDPDTHVLACSACAWVMGHDVVSRHPDIHIEGSIIQLKCKHLTPGQDPIIMTWLFNLFDPKMNGRESDNSETREEGERPQPSAEGPSS